MTSRATDTPLITDIDMQVLTEMLARTRAVLTPEDCARIQALIDTLLELHKLVRERGTTIARMRRLFGLKSSEKTADVLGAQAPAAPVTDSQPTNGSEPANEADALAAADQDGAGAGEQDNSAKPRRRGHGRIPASAYPSADVVAVAHERLRLGDVCPGCARGKLYGVAPARILRIVGQAPLTPKCWDCEQLRCSGCHAVYTAHAPREAQGPKYTDSAAAMLVTFRYSLGVPLNRLAHLQNNLGIPAPASTQWEVARDRLPAVEPVFDELIDIAADGRILHNDDTSMPVLELMGKRREELLEQGVLENPDRTGLFTTAVVSAVDHRLVALFFTGRKHAGENLARVLDQRDPDLPPPIHMCDGLDRNRSSKHEVVECNCTAHGRRHIVDEVNNFPAECRHALEQFALVFKHEEFCKENGLSGEARMRFHQEYSAPVLNELHHWMQAALDEKRVEPNSGLGEAFRYLLKRWNKLTLFLRVPDAPLDNNLCERVLKRAIRHRRNSLFYRSARGARTGDIYMSLLHTAELNGENAFDYLTALFENDAAVADAPAAWLPWTYRDTLAARHTSRAA